MKAIHINTKRILSAGDSVALYKAQKIAGVEHWFPTGEIGTFEEVTPTGLINFNREGKPRQCMPEGIGARLE